MKTNELDINELRDRLYLDPETGKVFWKPKSGNTRLVQSYNAQRAGKQAGYSHHRGYSYIEIGDKQYALHRVVFALHHGRWPVGEVDHINGLRSDNRPANLREATKSQNQANRGVQRNSKSGVKGVHYRTRTGKWRAQYKFQGKVYYAGDYATIEEAKAAYEVSIRRCFGEFARVE